MGGGSATGVVDGVAWLAQKPPRQQQIRATSALPPMLPAQCWVDLQALQAAAPNMPWVESEEQQESEQESEQQ